MNTIIRLFLAPLAFLSLSLAAPKAQAVVPPPDGGYPGFNTAEGTNALLSLTTGSANTAVGWFSLKSVTAGAFNTGVGAGTLALNTADQNTATGAGALLSHTSGGFNTANGAFALVTNSTGGNNTATGCQALFNNTGGSFNTANGAFALVNNTGDSNTAVGSNALSNSTTGSHNIGLGEQAGGNVNTASNVICIGIPGADVDNSCFIGQIFGATLVGTPTAVFVNQSGQLGTLTSSARFKDEIKPMDDASEAILALKPVKFRYKKEIDAKRIPQFGLVAEEVEKVNRDLVVRDKDGKPYSVRYEQVNAMLLNEFLKEHRKVKKLEATVAALSETVNEQAAQLRRVSAQVELIRPAMNLADTSQ